MAGVREAAAPADAVAASPLTVTCVSDYPAADEILEAPGVAEALRGRTLVQLSNGAQAQVCAQLARVAAAGARLLGGGIMAYPRHIGRPQTAILCTGDAAAFEEHRGTLAHVAGGQRCLGEDPAVQNAVYQSAFGVCFAALCGFLENAALVTDRGVPVAELAAGRRLIPRPALAPRRRRPSPPGGAVLSRSEGMSDLAFQPSVRATDPLPEIAVATVLTDRGRLPARTRQRSACGHSLRDEPGA